MAKKRVVYIINAAPNYRDKFLRELGKYVDLTVVSFSGVPYNLKDPVYRENYKYIELKRKELFSITWNIEEFTKASGEFDIIMLGFILRNPFRLINVFRNKPVILEGLIYGKNNNIITKILRKFWMLRVQGVIVYSEYVKKQLMKETKKPIISFNNTSFYQDEIVPLEINRDFTKLNIIWVGRYQKRKKLERLIELGRINNGIQIRIIGPGIIDNLQKLNVSDNVQLFDQLYDEDIETHYKWAHVVFNPGHVGLLVMSAAKYGRPIIIDKTSKHAPEIQLAVDAEQILIDFSDYKDVNKLITDFINNPNKVENLGIRLNEEMRKNWTIENMVSKYMLAINGKW
ncbi:MAG: glycosyltransferase [Bacteroidales bacterium]|jgi:glycosyltransferase involved in cell wall biosynthesis|nr:glycosyltransferase [Bacteroidales bacterium]MDX9795636.1 glycosyltransferase [Arcobacteraceae bacterium]